MAEGNGMVERGVAVLPDMHGLLTEADKRETVRDILLAALDEALADELVTRAEVHRSDVVAVLRALKAMTQGVQTP